MIILMYHNFYRHKGHGDVLGITLSEFSDQLCWMQDQGFCFIKPADSVEVNDKSVLVTIDDGLKSSLRALDIAGNLSVPTLSFLISKQLDGSDDDYISAGDIDSTPDGSYYASHSHVHVLHEDLSRWGRDLECSYQVVSSLPRSLPHHLAWPWGYWYPQLREIARNAGFEHQYGAYPGALREMTSGLIMPRIRIDGDKSGDFKSALLYWTSGNSSVETKLRLFANTCKGFKRGYLNITKSQ
ncbi:MAG: hypothetical protein HGB02_00150 [Chlorobiaceae bacterium]|nr:hypothetical protein [Chlorobiaceae bacterium]